MAKWFDYINQQRTGDPDEDVFILKLSEEDRYEDSHAVVDFIGGNVRHLACASIVVRMHGEKEDDQRRVELAKRMVRGMNNEFIKPKPQVWTVAYQKAGRLPEFLSEILFTGGDEPEIVEYLGENGGNIWYFKRKDGAVTSAPVGYLEPIETPQEKAARLREEWRIKALSSASILSGMQEYELKRLGGYIGDIYDALLSGELTMPSKDGE